jgi:hypothetical protein
MKILVRAFFAAACLHLLASCGGGVSSDNASSKDFFTLQPGTAEAYSGVAVVFTITGGQPPYTVSSSNTVVAPIQETNVTTKSFSVVPQYTTSIIPVVISVFDHAGSSVTATLNVNPNIISNVLTITPQATASGQPGTISCGSSVCSGGYATVSVALSSVTQSVANRPMRFDVDQGTFSFLQDRLGTSTGPSYTTATDASGKAQAVLRADAFAQSQLALLRVTDIVSGSVLRASFSIVRVIDGSSVISVLPQTTRINTFYKFTCSVGALADYFISGGAPPYAVGSSFDAVASLLQSTVATDGGRFTARTGGACGTALFTITDSLGRTTTATLENLEGTQEINQLSVLPATGTLGCGETGTFTIAGSPGPFVVSSSNPRVRATVSGSLIIATRLGSPPALGGPPPPTQDVLISASDGLSNAIVTLTVPDTCSP